MPEQLTKHPEVTLQVLRSAGARCAEGAPQEILARCPAERFCKLPGGEMCVFGLSDAARMTQVSPAEWQALVPVPAPAPAHPPGFSSGELLLGGSICLVAGLAFGVAASLWWRRRH